MASVGLPFATAPATAGPATCPVTVATAWPGRASWSGLLHLRLVTVPVKAYLATASREAVEFHQLHAGCGQRIRLQKYCPAHGPVESGDVIKGYEHAPGRYVTFDPAELERLRPASDRTVTIERVVAAHVIEPVLFAGRSFYLLPDGQPARRPYALVTETLRARRQWALARAVLSGRQGAVVIRPIRHALVMDTLHSPAGLREPGEGTAERVDVAAEEFRLVGLLLDSLEREVRWADFRDDTADRVADLVTAKTHGRPLPAPVVEEMEVASLLDALRQSLPKAPAEAPRPAAPRRSRKKSTEVPP
jgi:DNA end-binding protein Ku